MTVLTMSQASVLPPRPLARANRAASRRVQRGVTLIELMISLVLGLTLSLVMLSVYSVQKGTSRGIQASAALAEAGAFGIESLGREIQTAGAIPVVQPIFWANNNAASKNFGSFFDLIATANNLSANNRHALVVCQADYGTVASGWTGGTWAGATDCAGLSHSSAETAQAAILLNSYSLDSTSSSAASGFNTACNGTGGANADDSTGLVSNLYFLRPYVYTIEGRTFNTFSLSCRAQSQYAQLLVPGVDEMTVDIGFSDPGSTDRITWVSNDNLVSNMATLNSPCSSANVTCWDNARQVRLCLLVRTPMPADVRGAQATTATSGTESQPITRCAGNASYNAPLFCANAAPTKVQDLLCGPFFWKRFTGVYELKNFYQTDLSQLS